MNRFVAFIVLVLCGSFATPVPAEEATKADLLEPEAAQQRAEAVLQALGWDGEWAMISSVAHQGTDDLVQRINRALEEREAEETFSAELEADYGTPLPEELPGDD